MSQVNRSSPTDAHRSCRLYAAGHSARPFRHWRRMPASDCYLIEEMASDGPDTLVMVIGRTLDLENFPDSPLQCRTLRYCTHAADDLLKRFRRQRRSLWFQRPRCEIETTVDGVIVRYPLADPYRYQRCHELVPSPDDPERALELPYLKEREQISHEVTWARGVTLGWRDGQPGLEPDRDR